MADATHYVIEQQDRDGRWFVRGSDPVNGWAQHYMRQARKLNPDTSFRVVEYPSRRLIVVEGPFTAYGDAGNR